MNMTKMSVDEVNQRINSGEKIVFVDARSPKAWDEAETKLPGAVRVPPDEIEKHIADVGRDRTVVTYCT